MVDTPSEQASRIRPPFAITKASFQLATLEDELPRGPAWVYERKLDGYRAMADLCHDERPRLISRNGLSLAAKFPDVVAALSEIPSLRGCIVDGEVVAYEGDRVSFHALQHAGLAEKLEYLIFDLLAEDGVDLRSMPLEERKARLLARAPKRGTIRALPFLSDARQALGRARILGDEGILAKRRDAPYRKGRSRLWIKHKILQQDDFVVIGWKPSTNYRDPIGSLALATRDRRGGPLRYAGRVGTGFDREDRHRLAQHLAPLRAPTAACEVPASERRGIRWVLPEIVVRVAFLEETKDGVLRHASYRGERDDVSAEDVRKEPDSDGTTGESVSHRRGGHEIVLTNPEKVLLPETRATKAEIFAYYEAVAEVILPHLRDRPLQLVRTPDGPRGTKFFAHRPPKDAPEWLRTVHVEGGQSRKDLRILGGDVATLLWTVQLGCIEQHAWASAYPRLDFPLELHVDLDPPREDLSLLMTAAKIARTVLEEAGLVPYLKTSGKRGLHILAPLDGQSDKEIIADLALALGKRIVAEDPERLTIAFAKRERKGRLYVDVRRNRPGSALATVWSIRSTPRGTVSTPLPWEELTPRFRPDRYDLRTVKERLATEGDPWEEMRGNERSAEEVLERLVEH